MRAIVIASVEIQSVLAKRAGKQLIILLLLLLLLLLGFVLAAPNSHYTPFIYIRNDLSFAILFSLILILIIRDFVIIT